MATNDNERGDCMHAHLDYGDNDGDHVYCNDCGMEFCDRLGLKIERAAAIYRQAFQYNPARVIALYSGGHDSEVATDLIYRYGRDLDGETRPPDFVMHINTGINVQAEPSFDLPSPEQWVARVCKRFDWPLRVYRAVEHVNAAGEADPQVYADICAANDFPGPASHWVMYARLKERQIQRVVRDLRRECGLKPHGYYWKDPDQHGGISRWLFQVMLVAGCRKAESERRMGNTQTIQRQGVRLWVNPIEDFTHADIEEYMRRHKLPHSPIANLIHKSGECLCGAYAKPGELAELRFFCPRTATMIDEIAVKVKAAGHKGEWGTRPYKGKRSERFSPLCSTCEERFDAEVAK